MYSLVIIFCTVIAISHPQENPILGGVRIFMNSVRQLNEIKVEGTWFNAQSDTKVGFEIMNSTGRNMVCPHRSLREATAPNQFDMRSYDETPTSMGIYYGFGHSTKWEEAGKVAFSNLNPGKLVIPASTLKNEVTLEIINSCRSDDILNVKTVIQTTFNKEVEFLSFVKACAVLQAPTVLTLNMDHADSVIAASVAPSVYGGSFEDIQKPLNFEIDYIFKFPEAGPMPDTATYVSRLDKEREAKERGATQDTRSFFGKYWMYIVPVALFVLLSGSANSEAPAPAR